MPRKSSDAPKADRPKQGRQKSKRKAAAPTDARRTLVETLWRTAARQVSEIERRLMKVEQPPAERETDARALAVLVKTLRELSTLDEAHLDDAGSRPTTEAEDDDPVPRDIDEFRRELARRMDAFVQRRTGSGVPGG